MDWTRSGDSNGDPFAPADGRRLSWDEVRTHAQVEIVPTQNPTLPLADIEPEAFERLCAEMIDMLPTHSSVHIYGRRGQRQHGLDIVAFDSRRSSSVDARTHVYQVKRYQRFTPTDLRDAVDVYRRESKFRAESFTVVTSAPCNDVALIDELERLQGEYSQDFCVDLWGPDRVQSRLRQLPNTVRAVFGEAMAKALCGQSGQTPPQRLHEAAHDDRIAQNLRTALQAAFNEDDPIRFNEADLIGPSVDRVFVDVPVAAPIDSPAGSLLESLELSGVQKSLPAHDLPLRRNGSSLEASAGGAQALLNPGWLGSTVLIAGPGQGKSTLLQYICQVHRARHLEKASYEPNPLTRVSGMPRVPFRIDLRRYAVWRNSKLQKQIGRRSDGAKKRRRGDDGPITDVNDRDWLKQLPPEVRTSILPETYICEEISAAAAGVSFTADDLVTTVRRWPVLFAFDGLDEVAPVASRGAVSDALSEFRERHSGSGYDTQIVVTTRPGLIERPIWDDPAFSVLTLQDLEPSLKMQYVEKWATVQSLTLERRSLLLETFAREHMKPHVREVSSNPMQLAILCRLLDRKARVPAKRTAFYDEYIDVFFSREIEKNPTIRLVGDDALMKIHVHLGWWMHCRADGGKSDGTIGLDELRGILTTLLADIGKPTEVVAEMYNEMSARVICLVQRHQGSGRFEFHVQGIREYFAARYLMNEVPSAPGATKGERLRELIKRPYWNNVMRFAAGMLSDGELHELTYTFRELELGEFENQPLPRLVLKQLLDDQVFATSRQPLLQDLLRNALSGNGLYLSVDGNSSTDSSTYTFQTGPAADALVEVLKERVLRAANEGERRTASKLLLHQLDRIDNPDARAQIWNWWWNGSEAARVRESDKAGWIRSAAQLRLLSDLSIEEESLLLELLESTAVEQHSTLGLLARGGRWSPGPGLTERILADIAAGALSDDLPLVPVERSDPSPSEPTDELLGLQDDPEDEMDRHGRLIVSGDLGQLLRAAHINRFLESASYLQSGRSASALRAKHRFRGRTKAVRSAIADLNAAHDAFRSAPSVQAWSTLMDFAEDFWGDSWHLRAIILTTHDECVAAIDSGTTPNTRRHWARIAREVQSFDVNRGNADWWSTRLQNSTTDSRLTAMLRVAGAVKFLQALPLTEIGQDLNYAVSLLTDREWGLVADACGSSSELTNRPLRISQQLRTTFTPTPRLGALLLCRTDDPSTVESTRHILPGLPGLWGKSESTDLLLSRLLVTSPKKIKLDHLPGARDYAPAASVSRLDAVTTITIGRSKKVLFESSLWPTPVVRAAANKLEVRTTAKFGELEQGLRARGWVT